jgi:hypothetical protein
MAMHQNKKWLFVSVLISVFNLPCISQLPINQERFDLMFQESAQGYKWVYNGITHLFSIEIYEEDVKQVKYPNDISINKQVIHTAATPIRDTSANLSNLSIIRQKAMLTAYLTKKAGKLAAQKSKKEWVTVNSKLWLLYSYPVIKNSVPTKSRQLIVSTICFNQVLELNTTITNEENLKKAKILLNQLMVTLKLSNTPIDP